jgi:hypothetical protein
MLWKIATEFGGEWKYTSAANKGRGNVQRGSSYQEYDEWDDDD